MNVSFTARYVICTERSLPNVCDFAISTASDYIHLINTENSSLVDHALQLPIGPVLIKSDGWNQILTTILS